ncbi:ATP-binding protein [Streptomyces sp. NBC_00513]|uniref:ATP-binding protein n=1 Tax=unclassified Streptomyces TaxID=2593676 RepID=UPI00224CB75E|nr:ATP-binding protein [Streptomyces sp. NBC_00424]MCX5071443.1 ATP-binding protein [Streptomyces sp. NBC_00424]WUD45152.1 ATP-binding protein [Streptomyces sp. NBC_00513]
MPGTPRRTPGLRCEDARLIARDVLSTHHVGTPLVDDVLLVVSELVSNAIRHAGGVTAFRVWCPPGSVAVEVSDGSTLCPCPPGTPVESPGGFGWLLVNRIADRTEIRSDHAGKTITAFLSLTPVA